ncbi:FAD-dependent monooxygenase [Microtetraspora malaysiensis]|uniref:FAD-dependent monooxygenase n=1 Tax=Microtetraspora malaysiensis TaxID=161358 RepID=UPI003D94654C
MSNQTVLISGAGIAGSTLAYWLAQHGFRPTVVERAAGLRSSGNPVDVRGPAMKVVERMGLMPRLRAADSNVTDMRFVNAAGRHVGRINLRAFQMSEGDREPEVPRAELASILLEASSDDAEFLWDDTIVSLRQDKNGVNVTFDRAEPRRFDLVIGADGLHSAVRRLAFGPEADFVHHMGIYVATLPIDGPVDNDREVILYNAPGRMVSVHPSRGHAVAAFMFRSPALPGFDHRDTEQHKRLVTTTFADDSWRVPELLERVQAADDIYFDSVSQVRLLQWSSGRIAVLGDAASCVSLFGDGSTLAIAGAFTLAEELAAAHTDPETAFRRYESRHRTLVEPKLRGFGAATSMLIPATRRGIAVRNLATRLAPMMTAAGSLRRRLQPA